MCKAKANAFDGEKRKGQLQEVKSKNLKVEEKKVVDSFELKEKVFIGLSQPFFLIISIRTHFLANRLFSTL